ncbi:MAG: hypothetical protein M9953_06075 [Thermomicrobiales bacterium]|nr:hypothetical protein [Thermomicrobiales bacterium]MCO5224885.1 hypothetical protein [Thermomicrobiales bacterium]MCO5228473.1 hypothetical protein [Thermomicrobiales bacterium]
MSGDLTVTPRITVVLVRAGVGAIATITEPTMLFRLLLLLNLMGLSIGPDARDEEELGGKGFGTVIQIFVGIGALVLIMLIVLGIMALTGSFDLEHFDPTR